MTTPPMPPTPLPPPLDPRYYCRCCLGSGRLMNKDGEDETCIWCNGTGRVKG